MAKKDKASEDAPQADTLPPDAAPSEIDALRAENAALRVELENLRINGAAIHAADTRARDADRAAEIEAERPRLIVIASGHRPDDWPETRSFTEGDVLEAVIRLRALDAELGPLRMKGH